MALGMNALNQGKPLGVCSLMAAKGLQGVRVSANYDRRPWALIPDHDLIPLVQEPRAHGMLPYVAVRDKETVWRLPADAKPYVGAGNEPDLKDEYGWPSFDGYVQKARGIIDACEQRGFPCGLCVISNLNDRGLDYAAAVMKALKPERWVDLDFHWYWHPSHRQLMPSWSAVNEDGQTLKRQFEILKNIAGADRGLVCSELDGFSAAHGMTEAQVAAWYAFWRELSPHMGIKHLFAYQLMDGDTTIAPDTDWGFQKDWVWKPRADAFLGQGAFA